MEERAIKRLLVILGLSIVAILIFKSIMLKTATKASKIAIEKQQAVAARQAAEQQAATQPVPAAYEPPAAPATAATMDAPVPSPAASGVGDVR